MDLQEHVLALERSGLLIRVDSHIYKDRELHPLVRWQFRGGISAAQRKAFLFTNVFDSLQRKYDMPVLVGALAANDEVYRVGMGIELSEIGKHWMRALNNPLEPKEVYEAPCQEIIQKGEELIGAGKGLDSLPIPVSTPGFDSAPYITAGIFVLIENHI